MAKIVQHQLLQAAKLKDIILLFQLNFLVADRKFRHQSGWINHVAVPKV